MVLRKFSKITNNKLVFSQYNIFYNYEYVFFQSAFWSLFNQRQRSKSNQVKFSLCCGSAFLRVLLCTHYGPLQCFSTYFRKFKEIGVLWPILPDCYFLWLCTHWLARSNETTWIVWICELIKYIITQNHTANIGMKSTGFILAIF